MPTLLIGTAFGVLIAGAAYRAGALSASGAVAAAVLGTLVFRTGGVPASALLLLFFGGSSLVTRAFRERKREASRRYAKGGARDLGQVAANGAAAGAALLLFMLTGEAAWLFAYAGALAAANADTWATELGTLSTQAPRMITTGRVVPAGTSGAVSAGGTLASLAGAALIACCAALLYREAGMIAACTAAGFVGSIVDSWLGACCQAVYHCPECGLETELGPEHDCGTKTARVRGATWVTNDIVNLVATLSGAGAAYALGSL